MTDGIIKGSGNSRYLKTVANARTLYPTWDAALSALIQGTFPIDLNGINSSGWSTVGTKLNKASLLADSLCSALGLSTSATPTQAMDKLRQLVATAQAGVDSGVKIGIVSYTGTGTYGKDSPCSITFPFVPKISMYLGRVQTSNKLLWHNSTRALPSDLLSTEYKSVGFSVSGAFKSKKSLDGKTISFFAETADEQFNSTVYDYWFLGIK